MLKLKDNMQKCMRCHGQKKMFKISGGYSSVNSGGVLVNCPMCLGEGQVKTLVSLVEALGVPESELLEFNTDAKPKKKRILKLKTVSTEPVTDKT